MPQFHSARDIHDVYYLADPVRAKEIGQPYLDQVAESHNNGWKTGSRGWGYEFDRDFTKRLILRSQGTVLPRKRLRQRKFQASISELSGASGMTRLTRHIFQIFTRLKG
jgi:phenylalanyl-tRNA synthetase alpha chain